MQKKIVIFVLSILAVVIANIAIAPQNAFADDSNLPVLEQLQKQIFILQARIDAFAAMLFAVKPEDTGKPTDTGKPADTPTAPTTPAQPATPATPATGKSGGSNGGNKQVQQEQSSVPTTPSAKTGQTAKSAQPASPSKAPETLNFNRQLERGKTGNDVKGVQELLAKFPDIYPKGLATGFFGPLSEKAVKKLQEKFNIEQSGVVDQKTKGVLEELATAIGRKERPRITDISPSSISVNTEVLLTGSGFTFEDNAIFVKGRLVIKNLTSPDGSSLKFFATADIPCVPEGPACPIKVVNKNGISNAKPFKLIKSELPPEPVEPPVITPPPAPQPEPVINSISPSYGKSETEVNLYGTGFALTNNAINLAGISKVISNLSSSDGKTLKFLMPSSPCKILEPCAVSVSNVNGTSNSVNFTLTQSITPVVITTPNGGEKFIQGASNTISWTGGTNAVHIALVEETAIKGSDPMPFIVGWLSSTSLPSSSLAWSAKEVCDISGQFCYPVSPGSYKILAISENEYGKAAIDLDGSGNWDVSDRAFSVLSPPSITLLSPNGGERLVYGSSATISWQTTSILSQAVKINLLKGGLFYLTIASNFSQATSDGSFVYNWVVPSTISAENNYAIEVQDSVNPQIKDISDSLFSIGPQASIVVVAPNGGETWFKGFQATVRWNSGNILSKAVNIDLYKNGVFLRQLASNVPQKLYSWSTQTYSSGTGFNYTFLVPSDLDNGSDYTVQVSDSADSSVKDASNASFSVQTVPDPVTVNGRLINRFLNTALANTRLYLDGGRRYSNTGTDGEFSVSTTTASLFDTAIFGSKIVMPVGSWPNCYMNWRYDIFAANEYPYWRDHVFDLLADKTGVFNQGTVNLGNVFMWPGIGLYFYTNVGIFSPGVSTLASPGVIYPDSGYWGWQILALETDLQVKIYDPSTNTYHLSPSIRIPLSNGCTAKTLTFLNNEFKWEPYNIRSSAYLPSTLTVGSSVNTTFTASGGTAPYAFGLYYGSLPAGLTLNPLTGQISGIATTPGTYKFQIRITDANGVNGGTWPITVTVK